MLNDTNLYKYIYIRLSISLPFTDPVKKVSLACSDLQKSIGKNRFFFVAVTLILL